jgi:hypothetical protein
MSHLELRLYVDEAAAEIKAPSIADRFADVVEQIKLEYDLEPDVLAAAKDIMNVMKVWKENNQDIPRLTCYSLRLAGRLGCLDHNPSEQ